MYVDKGNGPLWRDGSRDGADFELDVEEYAASFSPGDMGFDVRPDWNDVYALWMYGYIRAARDFGLGSVIEGRKSE